MSGISQSSIPASTAQIYARLLTLDAPTIAAIAQALATTPAPGLALLASQSTADLMRIQRMPRQDRQFNDVFRTR